MKDRQIIVVHSEHTLLQAGSLIVENLRTYRQPVIIYLPPGAELRGGAWVVIDGQINPQQVRSPRSYLNIPSLLCQHKKKACPG